MINIANAVRRTGPVHARFILMKEEAVDIPYRLDTPEAISKAMEENLLDLGGGYETMLAAAARILLQRPPALSRARPFVAKSFILPKEKVLFEQRIIREPPRLSRLFGISPS